MVKKIFLLTLILVGGCSPDPDNVVEHAAEKIKDDNRSDFANFAIGAAAGAAGAMLINKITDKNGKTKYVDSKGNSFSKEQYEKQIQNQKQQLEQQKKQLKKQKNKAKRLKKKLNKIKRRKRSRRRR